MASARVDAWIWGVRAYKSRTQATDACTAGHVRVNGDRAKPSTKVSIGDTVVIRNGGVDRILEVTGILTKRVGAEVAARAYIDHTPPPPPKAERAAPVGARDRGAGRPTKRERRQIDKLRGR